MAQPDRTHQPAADAPAPSQARRTKWEAFWQGRQVAAEATHRLSVALIGRALRAEGWLSRGRAPRLLDLGCGGGRVIELLEAAGAWCAGADLAEGALRAARQRLGPGSRLLQADAFQLGLASASLDAVVSLGYASVGSYPGVQAELARVLRPGGLALIDFRRVGLYHLPLWPRRGRQLSAAWQRGEVSLLGRGLRPAPPWAAAGLRLEQVHLFNTYPPLGDRLPLWAYLAFERGPGRLAQPLLARTALAVFRRAG